MDIAVTITEEEAACHPLSSHDTEQLLNLLNWTLMGISPSAAPEREFKSYSLTIHPVILAVPKVELFYPRYPSLLSSGHPEFRNLSHFCKYNLFQNS